MVVTTTLATPKPKDVPKDLESSKAATARANALAPLAQKPVVTAGESHEEDDELAKTLAPTHQAKETQDDASIRNAVLDPQDPA